MLRSNVNLTLEEAQDKFKGCTVKNKGYHPDEGTQYLYKSEVNKKKRIICLLQGEPHWVPKDIHDNLRSYLENKTPLISDISYSDEKFIVPTKYLVNELNLDLRQLPEVELGKSPFFTDNSFATTTVVTTTVNRNSEVDEIFDEVKNILDSNPLTRISEAKMLLPFDSVSSILEHSIHGLVNPACNGDRQAIVKLISNILLLNKQKNVATK